jgi:tRNA threonylcarbamoyladenosine biosynthesis protein TsaB
MTALLAFDTSTRHMAIALVQGDTIRAHEEAGGAQVSARLIPALRALLARAQLPARELDAIAYGRGPGAFTGLRAACAVAQGFAFGLGKPVLALDTLMAVAEDARRRHDGADDIWVAMDARMDEIYAAHYRWSQGRWRVERASALYALDALHALWRADAPLAVAGSALEAFGQRLAIGDGALRIPDAWPRAAALALLARAAWHDGARLDPADALPLYLRDKVALTTEERAAARSAV